MGDLCKIRCHRFDNHYNLRLQEIQRIQLQFLFVYVYDVQLRNITRMAERAFALAGGRRLLT